MGVFQQFQFFLHYWEMFQRIGWKDEEKEDFLYFLFPIARTWSSALSALMVFLNINLSQIPLFF